jgi:hypothetical protein
VIALISLALSTFAPRVEEYTEQLLARLRKDNGKPVPVLDYCSYYSYDIVTDLSFGKPMGLIKGDADKAAKKIVTIFSDGLEAMGLMYHVPWYVS